DARIPERTCARHPRGRRETPGSSTREDWRTSIGDRAAPARGRDASHRDWTPRRRAHRDDDSTRSPAARGGDANVAGRHEGDAVRTTREHRSTEEDRGTPATFRA